MRRGCEVPGCGGWVKARGLCSPHYGRWYRHGDPLLGLPSDPDDLPVLCECEVPDFDGLECRRCRRRPLFAIDAWRTR